MSIILTIIIVLGLVVFSAMCSGLNIALMSLDINELRRKAKLGDQYARAILPLRENTHLALSAILLSNIAAVSVTSLVLESKFNGIIAGITTTLLIVVFGEVLPQALFAKKPLIYAGRLATILRLMVIVSYPISKPLQILLNKVVGHSSPELHSRRELGMMITEHLGPGVKSELDEDEIEIVQNALLLSEKRVHEIMTPIKDTYYLEPGELLTEARFKELRKHGYSRVPVISKQRTHCVGILLVKDLLDYDFNNFEEPERVDEMPLHYARSVGVRTALDTMFRVFIAAKTHLIPVEKDGHIVGVVTIEDLIEEILGHEIVDESDRSPKHIKSS